MSIRNYKNFDKINSKTDNEGKFIQDKDLLILSKNEVETSDFGDCKYDVMEISVYDTNNNLLPQKNDNNIAYIKSGDIKNYLYNITNNTGKKEIAIDIQKLLKDLGFTNGILRVNINFVRNRVGTDNELTRVWVQEISPSRSEIRVLPLKVSDKKISDNTSKELKNLSNLNKDFKYYKKTILDSINSFSISFLDPINSKLESKYGKDFFTTLRKDFGISDFNNFRKKIFEDFKTSVDYYLNNKYYLITDGNYGKQSEIRFEDCEQYDFDPIVKEIEKILYLCVEVNSKFLKRRDFDIEETPRQFKKVELVKQIQNNIGFFETPIKKANIVYSPENVTVIPTQPAPQVVQEKPQEPTPPKVEPIVVVPVTQPHFEYEIANQNSLRTYVFTFTDVTGATVQKTMKPGTTFTICALEGSVSVNETAGIVKGRELQTASINKKGIERSKLEYSIKKLNLCNTREIGERAPVVIAPETLPPKEKPIVPKPTSGGGGVTREEAAASTNQVITPRGPAISAATAAGQSETSAAFQPITRTDVRQTTLTGPVVD